MQRCLSGFRFCKQRAFHVPAAHMGLAQRGGTVRWHACSDCRSIKPLQLKSAAFHMLPSRYSLFLIVMEGGFAVQAHSLENIITPPQHIWRITYLSRHCRTDSKVGMNDRCCQCRGNLRNSVAVQGSFWFILSCCKLIVYMNTLLLHWNSDCTPKTATKEDFICSK